MIIIINKKWPLSGVTIIGKVVYLCCWFECLYFFSVSVCVCVSAVSQQSLSSLSAVISSLSGTKILQFGLLEQKL